MKEWRTDERSLICRCASEIELERVEFLWPGRIALGKHTSIGGDPGGGKSNLAMYVAAKISMRGEWPCDESRAPQGSVIILNAEDGAADTIVPRLHAAEADLGKQAPRRRDQGRTGHAYCGRHSRSVFRLPIGRC
jgi:hypothetical protein